ncbi:hypothetical protein NPIL_157541 [Nephila pilipes]|uniref:Uncharacterized protein n=1 Tax=Nephila pilipes TaxID=299642 RepID=A0A8X6I6L5_NEPPI|nr:hypothetical protein NPIL_157541 [Nephila pilipes]
MSTDVELPQFKVLGHRQDHKEDIYPERGHVRSVQFLLDLLHEGVRFFARICNSWLLGKEDKHAEGEKSADGSRTETVMCGYCHGCGGDLKVTPSVYCSSAEMPKSPWSNRTYEDSRNVKINNCRSFSITNRTNLILGNGMLIRGAIVLTTTNFRQFERTCYK